NQLFIQYWLFQKREDAQLINVGGRQRMYSQRLLAKSWLYYETKESGTLYTLNDIYRKWNEAHQGLILKIEEAFFLYNREQTLLRLRQTSEFIQQARKLIPANGQFDLASLHRLEQNQERFLLEMDLLVSLLQQDSDRKLSFVVTIEILFALLSLFMIYFEIRFVFQRINQRLQRQNLDLVESNELLEQYAHLAAHDLRTPIQNIINFSQLLFRRLGRSLEADEKEYMEYVLKASKRLKHTTRDLLQVASLQSRELTFQRIDPTLLIKEVLDDLESLVLQTQAQIRLKNMPDQMVADQHSLHLVFQNLITNGLKFAKKGIAPQIEIRYQLEGATHVFLVSDQGIGIAEAEIGHIFDLFQRAENAKNRRGSGIGLAITKRILSKHQGMIQVSSTLGEGTTFRISIPNNLVASSLTPQ
ncbi:MAG: ATP-binding protein, partial [Bacteroidota bacterium]